MERLKRTAGHLSDFGTLTSLLTGTEYFIERSFNKRLPQWMAGVSLVALGCGIASIGVSLACRVELTQLRNKRAESSFESDAGGFVWTEHVQTESKAAQKRE